MSGPSTYKPGTAIEKWLDDRLPIIRLGYDSFVDFPTPRNLNYWWTFGGILAVFLMIGLHLLSPWKTVIPSPYRYAGIILIVLGFLFNIQLS